MIEAYWDRLRFTLDSTLYILNADMGPYSIKSGNSMHDMLESIANYVQAVGITTIYVNSAEDVHFLPQIKEILNTKFSYNKELTMEVKI